ncbi:probable L-type lectin-domain containing receptor kinase I.6 [Panicum virgatum]|uniref:Protein kinase domain-containing protein n=1 Tax=Panicum virgatum TaxID=38727 RepID=A0A8T0V807_PANVG|nr:probable L-type lectin-domain containing receptor kinase I.6 [Panicum virgatum]KAG2629656.1 hypothetical protein PVAP13_3KG273200 [Panicum virgatum]
MSRLSMAILVCLALLMISCQLCSARNDPGSRGHPPAGAHLPPRCKLCFVVALPVAGVLVAAAAVALVTCLLRRRNRNAAAVSSVPNKLQGHRRHSNQQSSSAGVADKGSTPAAAAGSTGDSSWNVRYYDNPMSINPTMVRSPVQFWLSHGSSPSHHPSTSSTNHHRSPARSAAGSPLRRPGLPPVPGRAKPEERAVTGDPLAMYSPSISVLLKEFDYEQLHLATNNFGRKSLLGRRGGPWVVFKGTKFVKDEGLPATVAIKRFRTTFTDEQCKRIRGDLKSKFKFTLRHKNLVNLLGYSFGKGRFHLVYDYMTNGSLEQHLFPEANRGSTLSWSLRHSIVKDVAQGLYQLHVTGAPHGSIGASSIMLDHDSTAHLDDHFGYRPERIASGGGGDASALADRDAALQEDIADLGALVMELVSGRRRHSTAVVVGNATTTMPLDHWVRTLHGEGCLLDAVDPALEGEFNQAQASKLLHLGLVCRQQPDPPQRPSIHDVRMVLLDMKPMPEVLSLSKPASDTDRPDG